METTDKVDEVRRALVAPEVRLLAERTGLPESVVMVLTRSKGWDVEAAAAAIDETIALVAKDIRERTDAAMFYGGGPGGGKEQAAELFRHRISVHYGAALVAPRSGVITSCVS